MYYIGIDPGSTGAISVINDSGDVIEVVDMPMRYLMPRKSRAKKSKYLADGKTLRKKEPALKQDSRKVLDAKELYKIISKYNPNEVFCALELVSSKRGQGIKSTFTFGESFGCIKGVLESAGINYHLISPLSWQGYFELSGKSLEKPEHKISIMNHCLSIYPDAKLFGSRGGVKDGRSDAILIARYAYENKVTGNWFGAPPFSSAA